MNRKLVDLRKYIVGYKYAMHDSMDNYEQKQYETAIYIMDKICDLIRRLQNDEMPFKG